MKTILSILAIFTLTGCVFRIDTPYGTVRGDGKTVSVKGTVPTE